MDTTHTIAEAARQAQFRLDRFFATMDHYIDHDGPRPDMSDQAWELASALRFLLHDIEHAR